ncbi:hypothetical protein [Gemmatimonas groenlandica]|uniref:Lipocalin-like domain-containing protein n=1 Tax=Gemmatimonas groenlandica TaxID=2732249 RepID=A0A6M4IUZ9_9BACT|nr:hypothetical protein [Gemmatimonas groenlandica]QJR37407.1 hypothetical protein HKW67_18775 [Gemmatimonas groenlandica]
MKIPLCVAFVALALANSPVAAQSSLVGHWDIDYERGRRIENDVVTPVMGKATLTIALQGDSLVATLQPTPRPDGTPVPAATMSAKPSASGVVFVQKQIVQLNVDGEVRPQEATVTWTLQATGDVLSGTLLRALPMMPEAPSPTAVTGKRM